MSLSGINKKQIILEMGGALILALFVASSFEAWQRAKEKAGDLQSEKTKSTEEIPTTPCSPVLMWAERCLLINGHALFIASGDIADTDAKRAQGLSGRANLPENAGMLFIFDTPAQYSFWMHGMHFGLDFLWIRDGKIMEITQNVPPPALGEAPQTITPSIPIDMVLEVNAGWVEKNGVQTGAEAVGL